MQAPVGILQQGLCFCTGPLVHFRIVVGAAVLLSSVAHRCAGLHRQHGDDLLSDTDASLKKARRGRARACRVSRPPVARGGRHAAALFTSRTLSKIETKPTTRQTRHFSTVGRELDARQGLPACSGLGYGIYDSSGSVVGQAQGLSVKLKV